jgi:hypothetical protein
LDVGVVMVVPPDALSTRLGVGDLVEGLRSQHFELAVDQADAGKVEIVIGGLHDPRLQIADRAMAEAQEAREIVVCPRFPLPGGSRPAHRPRNAADGRRFIPPCR